MTFKDHFSGHATHYRDARPLYPPALFDWLAGKATPIDGWQPDVAQVANGRVRAHRYAPPPQADLRVVFER